MNKKITRVLLVEDEDDAREILAFYLSSVFSELEISNNGQDALDLYIQAYKEERAFDLVITDMKMPKKDGLSMMEDIVKINKKQKFIIISAHKDEEYLFKSINMNVLSYFLKPLVIHDIMEVVKEVNLEIIQEKKSLANKEIIIKVNDIYTYNSKSELLYESEVLVPLSKKETLLLSALIKNIDEIKTAYYLKEFIWQDTSKSDATLRTVIKRLKDKISAADFISSKKGLIYARIY